MALALVFGAGLVAQSAIGWVMSAGDKSDHAWLPDCERLVGAAWEARRGGGVGMRCREEAGRVGVLVGTLSDMPTMERRERAEEALGVRGLAWAEGAPGRSWEAFLQSAGVRPAGVESRWSPRVAPWLGEASSWGREKWADALGCAVMGWRFAALLSGSVWVVCAGVWLAFRTASFWGKESKAAAQAWVSSAEFRAHNERRILKDELGASKPEGESKRRSARL